MQAEAHVETERDTVAAQEDYTVVDTLIVTWLMPLHNCRPRVLQTHSHPIRGRAQYTAKQTRREIETVGNISTDMKGGLLHTLADMVTEIQKGGNRKADYFILWPTW